MKKWWWMAAAAMVIGAIALYVYLPGNPLVEGRRLSDWIVASQSGEETERLQAHAVIGRLGKRHVPLLLEWLGEEPGTKLTLADQINRAYSNSKQWLMKHRVIKTKPIVGGLLKVK